MFPRAFERGLACAGLASVAYGLYGLCLQAQAAYARQVRLQDDNQWLYRHCLDNEKLREKTDACDDVMRLFAVSPLQAALSLNVSGVWEHALTLHEGMLHLMLRHRLLCLTLWMLLFLILPRLLLPLRRLSAGKERERLFRQAAQSIASPLRFRPSHRYMV